MKDNILVATDSAKLANEIFQRFGQSTGGLAEVVGYQETMTRCQKEAGNLTPDLRWYVNPFGYARAAQSLRPADAKQKNADGKLGTPDTVMLRLIDPNGRPIVKMGGSLEGAGLGLAGGAGMSASESIIARYNSLARPDTGGNNAPEPIGVQLEKAVEKRDVDLLVLGTHGYAGLAHAFIGTVAGDVLRAVTCDVLVVPPRPIPSKRS